MPANNVKIMSRDLLFKLKSKYIFEYDSNSDEIIVRLSTCKRVTRHSAKEQFHINSKKPKRKICFSKTVIDAWLELRNDNKFKLTTLLDVQNAVVSLKVMYQKISLESIKDFLKKHFEGIKKI